MTDYKALALSQLEKIQSLKAKRAEAVEDIRKINHVTIARTQFPIDPEKKEEAIRDTMESFDKQINALFADIITTLYDAKKKAIQDLTAAQPIPSDTQRQQVGDLVKKYEKMPIRQKRIAFEQDRGYHFENETVLAYPYILATQELYPEEDISVEWIDRVSPTLPEKRAALQNIEAAIDSVEAYKLTTGLTNGGLSTIESVMAKSRLYELGADPNPELAGRYQRKDGGIWH